MSIFGSLYKLTNVLDGKAYIGQTTREVDVRVNEHLNHSGKQCRYLKAAIEKYGKEYFVPEVLDTADSKDELDLKEIAYIEFYKSDNRDYGYNLTKGGSKITQFSKNHNNGWGENRKERAKKMRAMFKGIAPPESSIRRSKEVNSEPTINLTTGEVFASAREMAKHYNLSYSHTVRLLMGDMKSKNGEIFRYQDYEKQKRANTRATFLSMPDERKREVVCTDTNEKFNSIAEASEKLEISRTAISNNLSGLSKRAGGLKFAYAESQIT